VKAILDLPENPLVESLERLPAPPTALVILGATGDLARRKLLPAIYDLAHDGALPERFFLIGVARGELSDEQFRAMAGDAIRQYSRRTPDGEVLWELLGNASHVGGSLDEPQLYDELEHVLAGCDAQAGVPLTRCFYLATAPQLFGTIIRELGDHRLNRRESAAVRIVVEKPFGTGLEDARALNRELLSVFSESQVFRIDHYLGKETVQNLMAVRFANHILEPVWNRNYIEHVQVTAAEDIGVGGRVGYYDSAGALRDLVQNHLLQLMCHIAIEPPAEFGADDVRNEKVKVLRAIVPPSPQDVDRIAARGQYTAGTIGGESVRGYTDEEGVPPDSVTETFAALRLEVDNWRWAGVPFYLRTGKRLPRRLTEIAVTLKPVPHLAFDTGGSSGVRPNRLVFTIQPDEGVSLSLSAKIPGSRMRLRPVDLDFRYGVGFLSQSPEAYERLILDAIRGDATLFTRGDEVEMQWRICDPILAAWRERGERPPPYPAGSQGPAEAAGILLPGHAWRVI
jgi:glucose-6-phosphate 1-dehydrogenase